MKSTISKPATQQTSNIPWLDGLRGVAALWVLLSHLQILSGLHPVKVLSWGGLAVDLFMMLSGFLMAYHYIDRQAVEPWDSKKTILKFWVRRFFRIAPLFYVLLVIAFVLGPWLGDCRDLIATHWPTTATASERYHDNGLVNLWMHLSFVFGFVPQYSFRSPLPDWSIGLEMQFYLAFPFVMLAMWKVGPIVSTVILLLGSLVLRKVFPDFFHAFPMPSFLLIKLYMFMIGIWIAYARWQGKMRIGFMVALCIGLVWLYVERGEQAWARLLLITIMFYLMDDGSMPASQILARMVQAVRDVFSSRISAFLGDTSYACYLLHLLIVIPVCAWLTHFDAYLGMSGWGRFFTSLLIVALPIYVGAWVLYHHIEKNGIKLGKQVIKKI